MKIDDIVRNYINVHDKKYDEYEIILLLKLLIP